ncbi:MAG: SCP2 sterol-binding domain-containing protein [Actinobacteria bacterium]|nr:SCP2 sterol-binding domain-containing protein [Actinomycetota bacterium]
MPAFLSDEWLHTLDIAARSDDDLRTAAAELDLIIQQKVTGTSNGDVAYHVVLTPAAVGVRPGVAPDPTITFTTDLASARAIANGSESAQAAFIDGRLRVGGDLRRLLDAQGALARLGDTLAAASHA